MNKLKFLRVVYILPLLLIGTINITVPCEQCGNPAFSEMLYARFVSNFDPNFLCSMSCAEDYLRDNPLEYDENGNIIPKT